MASAAHRTPVTVRVRPAEARDAPAWLAMRETLWPTDGDDHVHEIAAYFDGSAPEPEAVFMAVDESGRAVGFAELSIRHPYVEGCSTNRVAYLEGWFVAPHARRQGVGRALVVMAEEWGRSQGCSEFASDTAPDNDASAAAHRALGFDDVGLIRCFRKDL